MLKKEGFFVQKLIHFPRKVPEFLMFKLTFVKNVLLRKSRMTFLFILLFYFPPQNELAAEMNFHF